MINVEYSENLIAKFWKLQNYWISLQVASPTHIFPSNKKFACFFCSK